MGREASALPAGDGRRGRRGRREDDAEDGRLLWWAQGIDRPLYLFLNPPVFIVSERVASLYSFDEARAAGGRL